MEMTNMFRDENCEIANTVKIESGNYFHQQVEKRNGLVFMRAKSRKLFEVIDV